MASVAGWFAQQSFTDSGDALVAGRLYTFAYGTTSLKVAFIDQAGTIPHTYTPDGAGGQYIGLNMRGELPAPLYLASGSYDIALKRADGSTVWTKRADPTTDGPQAAIDTLRADLHDTSDATKGSGQVSFNPSLDAPSPSTVAYKLRAYRDSRDIPGLKHDGTADATAGLQQLFDYAWFALYFQSGTWIGTDRYGANPVIKIAPGRFKLGAQAQPLVLATGSSLSGFGHPANTVSHTVLVRDSTGTAPAAGDGRGIPIIKLSRATKNNAALANAAWTGAISNLEFAAVTMGNFFDLPRNGGGIPYEGYPTGGAIYIDVDVTDARIENVCFQHGAAAVRGVGVGQTPAIRGDGFTGSRGINMFFKGCEFDAAAIHLWFTNCHLDLEFDNCAFYGGASIFEVCTGRVVFHSNCRFYGGAYINATSSGNNFSEFVVNSRFEASTTTPSVLVGFADFVSIDAQVRGASGQSAVIAVACRGGRIAPVIQDSGYNAQPWPPSIGTAEPTAALRVIGCQNVVVEAEIGTVATGGAWNGFGILSQDGNDAPVWGTNLPSKVIIKGAICTAAYNAATYRNQTRNLNVAAGDVVLSSYTNQRPGEERSTTGLALRGMTLIGPSLLGDPYSFDFSSVVVESGVYLATVETQLDANRGQINFGTFIIARRNAGGVVVQQLAISNPSGTSGAIALSGSLVSINYAVGFSYQLTVRSNKLADNGVE